jgi:protein-S-isoprenylcysteine O-methyltransferase Ste14
MPAKKPLPPTYLFLALVLMLLLRFVLPLGYVIRFPWSLIGVIPLVIGIYLNLAADSLLKKHSTTVKPFEQSSALVTTGVYSRTRHPMYSGFFLILLGLALLMGSLSPFVVVVLFPLLMEALFIRTEERMLAEHFGDVWLTYKARVRRWL